MLKNLQHHITTFVVEVVAGIAVTILLATGATYWAYLQRVSSITLFEVAIITLASTLTFINQFGSYRQRRNRGFATRSDEYIESTLRTWLDKEHYSISTVEDPNMRFQFRAEIPTTKQSVFVARARNLPDFILIGGVSSFGDDLKRSMTKLSSSVRSTMLEELKLQFLNFGVAFASLEEPFEKFGIEVRVPCDETCTKYVFLESFSHAYYAILAAIIIIQATIRKAGIGTAQFQLSKIAGPAVEVIPTPQPRRKESRK